LTDISNCINARLLVCLTLLTLLICKSLELGLFDDDVEGGTESEADKIEEEYPELGV